MSQSEITVLKTMSMKNFSEFIEFFLKGLYPFKIKTKFNFVWLTQLKQNSANMFYLLKHLLLLILVIFNLKCNNLIFNEIIILNASYVCLHAFSLR
jgi:hypothetical protein